MCNWDWELIKEIVAARKARRLKLIHRDGIGCFYCGIECEDRKSNRDNRDCVMSEDHIIPKSHGGTDDLDNLVLACRACNSQRGSFSAEDFLILKMAERGFFNEAQS